MDRPAPSGSATGKLTIDTHGWYRARIHGSSGDACDVAVFREPDSGLVAVRATRAYGIDGNPFVWAVRQLGLIK